MLLLRLWNYVRGYVIIIVEGYFLEKFINICIHRQIFLWDLMKTKGSSMRLKVSINGFKMLRPIAKKTGCRVRIYKKKGIPFTLNRYRRRKAFVFGALAFFIILYVLTSFVWTVEVSGNKKLETQYLIEKLETLGIKPGVIKYKINPDSIAGSMMLEVKELAWVGVAVKGTKVKVDVFERKQPPEIVPKNVPCDIIAARDGVVKSIIAKSGQEKVKVGDSVTKGQVLIAGAIESRNIEAAPIRVHAMGSVKARTWYEGRSVVNSRVSERKNTGNKKDEYYLVLLTKKIKIPSGRITFPDYERIEIRKKLSLGRDMVLPFEFIIERYYEVNVEEKEVSFEDARQTALEAAQKEALGSIPENAEIITTNVDYTQSDNGEMAASVIVECVEEIGVTSEIGGT